MEPGHPKISKRVKTCTRAHNSEYSGGEVLNLLVLGPYGETISGPSRVLTEVVNRLSDDIRVLVVSPRKRSERERSDARWGNVEVKFQSCGKIPGVPGSHQWIELVRIGRRLAELDFQPNIVWIHDAVLFAACRLSRFRRIRSISTIHGVFGEYYKSEAQQQLDLIATDLFARQNMLLQQYQFRNSIVLTTYSSYLRGLIKTISPSSHVKVIPNGVNIERFPSSVAPRKNIILYVGRMAKIKGVHVLIASMKEVAKAHPDWSLQLVGGAFDQPRSFFEKFMTPETVKRIEFLGPVPNEALPSILNNAGIFVMPTIRDGFEIAMMEAMATGIPCVTTSAFERKELYGGYAETVPPNDALALGAKLNQIIDNYSGFVSDSSRARRVSRAREFDWSAITRLYENLFMEHAK